MVRFIGPAVRKPPVSFLGPPQRWPPAVPAPRSEPAPGLAHRPPTRQGFGTGRPSGLSHGIIPKPSGLDGGWRAKS